MKKVLLIGVVVLVLALGVQTVMAYGPGFSRNPVKEDGCRRPLAYGENCRGWYGGADGLNLTDEQIDQLAELQKSFIDETADLRTELRKAAVDYRSLTAKNAPEEEITAAREVVDNLREALAEKRDGHRALLLQVLTPEQQEQVKQSFNNANCPGFGGCGERRGFGRGMGRHMSR